MELDAIRTSGLLELYVIGDLDAKQEEKVEQALLKYPELREELHAIEDALEGFAHANAMPPPPTVGPLILAIIDYQERLAKGEEPTLPPLLASDSSADDYTAWLSREDFQQPPADREIFAKILGANNDQTTLVVWMRDGAPTEVHSEEIESFLILEGACNIVVEDKDHHLVPGDYFTIPLHANHHVKVTSEVPCKVILERKVA